MSTRKLRYFVAVAEELHFSRAAARLFVAQQALSKQTRELEDAIGVQLLRRTTRAVELTPAGAAFLAAAKAALAMIDDGIETARRTARGEVGTLNVGFMIGAALELTAPILEEFTERNPGIELALREFGFEDPSCGLTSEWADVAFVRTPITGAGLEFVTVFVEPVVAALPKHHRLAGRDSVTVQEMLREKLAVGRTDDAEWMRFWALDEFRDGTAARRVVLTASQTEEAEIISTGASCAVTAAGGARYLPHPGIRFVPIEDAPGSVLAIGRRAAHASPLVDRFLAAATDVRDREVGLLAGIERPFDPPVSHNQTV